MEWLAGLRVEWVLFVAFVLVAARWILIGIKRSIGPSRERFMGELVESLLFAWVAVFLVIRPFLGEPFSIPSPSMHNTLLEGDRIIVTKLAYRMGRPQRGDVVVFKSPPEAHSDEVDFVKRLIGLPGDTINISGNKVWINGKPLNEPYVPELMRGPPYPDSNAPTPPYKVPPGHYFMMGDNRNQSLDSRYWGYLDGSRIKGRAIRIFWPPRRWISLGHINYKNAPN